MSTAAIKARPVDTADNGRRFACEVLLPDPPRESHLTFAACNTLHDSEVDALTCADGKRDELAAYYTQALRDAMYRRAAVQITGSGFVLWPGPDAPWEAV